MWKETTFNIIIQITKIVGGIVGLVLLYLIYNKT